MCIMKINTSTAEWNSWYILLITSPEVLVLSSIWNWFWGPRSCLNINCSITNISKHVLGARIWKRHLIIAIPIASCFYHREHKLYITNPPFVQQWKERWITILSRMTKCPTTWKPEYHISCWAWGNDQRLRAQEQIISGMNTWNAWYHHAQLVRRTSVTGFVCNSSLSGGKYAVFENTVWKSGCVDRP